MGGLILILTNQSRFVARLLPSSAVKGNETNRGMVSLQMEQPRSLIFLLVLGCVPFPAQVKFPPKLINSEWDRQLARNRNLNPRHEVRSSTMFIIRRESDGCCLLRPRRKRPFAFYPICKAIKATKRSRLASLVILFGSFPSSIDPSPLSPYLF